MNAALHRPPGLELLAAPDADVLSPAALELLVDVVRRFGPSGSRLLEERYRRQAAYRAGETPGFLPETRWIRDAEWRVAPAPPDLLDRRVEITGPVDRKMIINALNSGASAFMADFEDSLAPTWANLVAGQRNLRDAALRTIEHVGEDGRRYTLNERTAVLIVRPRGWHLDEPRVLVDGRSVPGALFDVVLFLFHCARELLDRGTGPYLYLPKLEGHREARVWSEVLDHLERRLALPPRSVRCTVLIETLPAAFEMDEILYELRDRVLGLNCGRWDYIFSFIKTLGHDGRYLLPDRHGVTMESHFLRSYSKLLIRTCHRRGAFAMGGMSAFIPVRSDPTATAAALERVRADKRREVGDGHDGTWVAHPALVTVAREVFDEHMPGANQLDRPLETLSIGAEDLLRTPAGKITDAGLRNNAAVLLRYLAAWLAGRGCVPIFNLMEDAATAEISRVQLWQWRTHRATLDDGRRVTDALVAGTFDEERASLQAEVPAEERPCVDRAAELALDLVLADEPVAFLTLPAQRHLA